MVSKCFKTGRVTNVPFTNTALTSVESTETPSLIFVNKSMLLFPDMLNTAMRSD